MPQLTKHLLAFGAYRIDPAKRLLFRGEAPVPLPGKAFDLLLTLLQRPGEVVSKDALMKAVWPDSFVEESNLSQNIFVLRKALGEKPQEHRFIMTVPGRGYSFVATLDDVAEEDEDCFESDSLERVTVEEGFPPEIPALQTGGKRRLKLTVILCSAVLLLLSGYVVWRQSRRIPRPTSGKIMLAVLPFENLTGNPDQEYLTDGFSEEMIADLGKLNPPELGIIARTSVEHYKGAQFPLRQISRELGVEYVLEGSVRRDAARVRIAAQLIRTGDQTQLWARQYDRDAKDLLQVQEEISQEISDEIQRALGVRPAEGLAQLTRVPVNEQAYDLYLKGRYFWNQRTPQGLRQAITLFEEAIEKDPGYARAYAGLADSYAMMSGYGLESANDCMSKARAAALRALQIDDSMAEAHTSLAVIAEDYDYDWQTSEKEFRRAIELNPNYATAHHWYAEYLAFQGRFDEALAESERARQLDPLSLIIAADGGAILYFSRQYDRAIERFHGVLDLDPGVARAHLIIAAYVQKRQFKEALADIETWRRTSGNAPWIAAWETYVYGQAGNLRDAHNALQRVQRLTQQWQVEPSQFMIVCYAGLNDKDHLLELLEKVTREHTNSPTGFKVDPLYDPLRNDPRFKDLLHHVGLDK